MSLDDILLEPEQTEFLGDLVSAHQRLDRASRQDFRYSPAMTRSGGRPRAELEKAIDDGGSVSLKGQLITRKGDFPWDYDRDVIYHQGLSDGKMETLQSDVDALTLQDLVSFRDKEHFFITPMGFKYHQQFLARDEQLSKDNGNEMSEPSGETPTAFMSYAWEDEDHQDWVHDFAARLRGDGVDVKLDRWEAVLGDQLPAFMERAVRDNKFVLIVCTPKYKAKSDGRQGGVGYEGDVMTGEVFTQGNQRKFIPILRKGEWKDAAPSWLTGKYYVDLKGDPYSERHYQDLLLTLHDQRPKAPPVGPSPFKKQTPAQPSNLPTLDDAKAVAPGEPIKIKGILVDGVTTPRGDGTQGSALYAVPFQLSRHPSPEWARLLVKTWNHPPQWSTMHRPGIARVSGDRIILDGTTVDEVERYHRDTLRLVVDDVNQKIMELEKRNQRQTEAERKRLQEHEDAVRQAASRISFD
jgi:hypothetical protein